MTERRTIPAPVIAVVADALVFRYSRTELDGLFETHGAPGEAPAAKNKTETCKEWLRRVNGKRKDPFFDPDPGTEATVDPLAFLGRVLEEFMDVEIESAPFTHQSDDRAAGWTQQRARVRKQLAQHGLSYGEGGKIFGASLSVPTRSLDEKLRTRDLSAVQDEVARALAHVESDPPAALTAGCALLEAVCKAFIVEECPGEMPTKPDLQPLWKVVHKKLNFDPAVVEGEDLKQILSGLFSIVHGVSSLRTHKGSAHGQAPARRYKIEPRHARLAVHAAHTLALFVLETWDRLRSASSSGSRSGS